MKPANNAETAAATHAKEDARCREEGGRKRERESGGVYVVYAALRGLRYSLKALPLSLSLLFVPNTETQVVLIFRSDFWMKGEEEVKREACLNLKMVENYPGSRYMSNSLLSIQM